MIMGVTSIGSKPISENMVTHYIINANQFISKRKSKSLAIEGERLDPEDHDKDDVISDLD